MFPITSEAFRPATEAERRPRAWDNRDFRLLWTGQSISRLGTQVTQIAIPLIAVIVLYGSPLQVSGLLAAEFAPALLFGSVAGVWVDRLNRRWVLIITDVGRFVSLGSIAALAATGHITFFRLYVATFATGVMNVLYDSASQAMLPAVVEPKDLLDANGMLEMSRAVATGTGPVVGGVLTQAISAAAAVFLDAVSYLVSGIAALLMRPQPRSDPSARQSFMRELVEGLRYIFHNRVQWRMAAAAAADNFFASAIVGLYILYAVRDLHLSPLLIGVVFGSGTVGAVAVSMMLKRTGQQAEPLKMILLGVALRGTGFLLAPLAGGATTWVVILLCAGQILSQGGIVLVASSAMTWRQRITPNRLLGRVIASTMTVLFGAVPLGAVFAGVLADSVGARVTLLVGALGAFCTALWFIGLDKADRGQPEPAG